MDGVSFHCSLQCYKNIFCFTKRTFLHWFLLALWLTLCSCSSLQINQLWGPKVESSLCIFESNNNWPFNISMDGCGNRSGLHSISNLPSAMVEFCSFHLVCLKFSAWVFLHGCWKFKDQFSRYGCKMCIGFCQNASGAFVFCVFAPWI